MPTSAGTSTKDNKVKTEQQGVYSKVYTDTRMVKNKIEASNGI